MEIGRKYKKSIYERCIKRSLDTLLSLIALIILSPVFLVTALLVKVKLGSPVIFKQERPGKDEKIFTLYKFRTMSDEKDGTGALLPDEERLKPFGKALRATSLDELPELVNIIKGDMAIVGPRPLLVRYLSLYDDRQRKRHRVRPGLSGLAQVSGRNTLSWADRFELDVKYTDDVSFKTDLIIVLKTVGIIFKREGISGENSVTMEEFLGNEDKRDKP